MGTAQSRPEHPTLQTVSTWPGSTESALLAARVTWPQAAGPPPPAPAPAPASRCFLAPSGLRRFRAEKRRQQALGNLSLYRKSDLAAGKMCWRRKRDVASWAGGFPQPGAALLSPLPAPQPRARGEPFPAARSPEFRPPGGSQAGGPSDKYICLPRRGSLRLVNSPSLATRGSVLFSAVSYRLNDSNYVNDK